MVIFSSISVALKNLSITMPYLAATWFAAVLPFSFLQVSLFFGPHVLSSIGALFGSAIRFHYLKMPWKNYPVEAFFAFFLGFSFGQIDIPILGNILKTISPEMFPLANGTMIGLVCSAVIGGGFDALKEYLKRKSGTSGESK